MGAGVDFLTAEDPRQALQAFRREVSSAKPLARLGRTMEDAVGGSLPAVKRYVAASRRLVLGLLRSAHRAEPDLILKTGSTYVLVDLKKRPADYALDVLELGVLEAPFSPWVALFGGREGVALYWISRLRETLPGHEALRLPAGRPGAVPHRGEVTRDRVSRFLSAAGAELQALHGAALPLLRLQELLGLNTTELGRLFGVSRQAAAAWLERGVPAERLPKLQTVLAVAELLDRKLKGGRLPAVARQPAEAYGGRSILEMMAADRHQEVLDGVRRSFDWSAAA